MITWTFGLETFWRGLWPPNESPTTWCRRWRRRRDRPESFPTSKDQKFESPFFQSNLITFLRKLKSFVEFLNRKINSLTDVWKCLRSMLKFSVHHFQPPINKITTLKILLRRRTKLLSRFIWQESLQRCQMKMKIIICFERLLRRMKQKYKVKSKKF